MITVNGCSHYVHKVSIQWPQISSSLFPLIDETYQIVCNNQANFGCCPSFEFAF